MLKQFVVSADEVTRLQNGSDPECKLAQKVFEQGHYAGRTRPTNTRQGTYATAPSGIMLASINSNDPKAMADMLRRALNKWNSMSQAERMLGSDPGKQKAEVRRGETQFPADGLVLRVFSRDLPREQAKDWRNNAWNQDYAWFTKDEVRTMLPAKLTAGQKTRAPQGIIDRLAKFNFVDNVRGQTLAYNDLELKERWLDVEVLRVASGVAVLRLSGKSVAESEGRWSVSGYRDMDDPQNRKRGMSLEIRGSAQVDIATGRFTQLDMLALGTRFGGTQYNGRHDDLSPAPIGFALGLSGKRASERVAPSYFYAYRWPR